MKRKPKIKKLTMSSRKINSLRARKILDSRGNWTLEVELETPQGLFRDSAPAGASTGKYEAPFVSSQKAIENINKIIAPKLKRKDVIDQKGIDEFLNPERFGANATTPVSMAVCRAGAAAKKIPLYKYINKISNLKSQTPNLPTPCFNMINGGVHASNQLDFQEFMVVCNILKASTIYQDLRKKLGKNVGDEGGFAPNFKFAEEALEFLSQYNVKIIIDVAASQFFINGKYKTRSGAFTAEGLMRYYFALVKRYPIIGLEDPFAENDWQDWQNFNLKIKNLKLKILLIGDDLLVTNPQRIKLAKEKNACNAAIIKINQIGTIMGAIEAVKLAKSYGWKIIVSHRSGETSDDFIADFAVGVGADFIKTGAPARGERVAKYNRLLRIAEEL